MIQLKSKRELDQMAVAGEMVALAFQEIAPFIAPGVTTLSIDDCIRDFVTSRGGELLFLNYNGFPAHSCISINDEVVHGIPGPRRVADGDLVSIDIGVRIGGFCGDSARTFAVGDVPEASKRVLECCRNALAAGVSKAVPGTKLSELVGAIEAVIRGESLGLVENFVGHGIGREMHEEPQVPNFVSNSLLREDFELKAGLVLAIEPMVNSGSGEVKTLSDGWTVATVDGGVSAHCEHTVAVTESGPRVMTIGPGEEWPPVPGTPGQ